jgi:hypothetical protein
MNKFVVLFLLALFAASAQSAVSKTKPAASSAAAQNPCADAAHHEFDFWKGDWQVSWPAAGPGSPAGTGHNHITSIMDGCVIQEQFDGRPGITMRGTSVSVYVPQAKGWKQTWVDNQGGYLDFSGGMEDGSMVLSRDGITPQGQKVKQRMVWKNITHDAFDWSWERSTDEGKTWTTVWPIHYTRIKRRM